METFIKKLYGWMHLEKVILLIPLLFLGLVWSFVCKLMPHFTGIITSVKTLAWSNPWTQILAFEMFLICFLGFLLDAWFYNTERIKAPFVFLSYIGGGIIGTFIPALIILAILESFKEGSWNLLVLEPLFGALLGLIAGFFLNFKK